MSIATYDPNAPAITVTDSAARYFESKLKGNSSLKSIRLSTETSGCTGYGYVLDFVDSPEADDEIFSISPLVTLSVDRNALDILKGTEIDLVVEGVNQVIKFNNPNVVAECGCGESFSVS